MIRFVEPEQKGTRWPDLTDDEKQAVREWYGRIMADSEYSYWFHIENGKVLYAN